MSMIEARPETTQINTVTATQFSKTRQPKRHENSGLSPRQAKSRKMLGALTPLAIGRLKSLILSENEQVALGACREVLDRNWGRAAQRTTVDVNVVATADAHVRALVELARMAKQQHPVLIDATPLPIIEQHVPILSISHPDNASDINVVHLPSEQVTVDTHVDTSVLANATEKHSQLEVNEQGTEGEQIKNPPASGAS